MNKRQTYNNAYGQTGKQTQRHKWTKGKRIKIHTDMKKKADREQTERQTNKPADCDIGQTENIQTKRKTNIKIRE